MLQPCPPLPRRTIPGWALLLFGAFLLTPLSVRAAEPAAAIASAVQDELPPLPSVKRSELPPPQAKELQELDTRLAQLQSDDPAAREAAARELLEVDARLVPAIAQRLDAIGDAADKESMKRLFLSARKQVGSREADADAEAEGKAKGPDYLTMLVTRGPRDDKAYRDLVAVIAMSRMLTQIGSVEAVRTLIDVYVRFGDFLRIHTQRELFTLGDRAVPALLEAKRHPAEKIGKWAARQLDALGRAVPSEAVQTPDPRVLADVLRAYGRVRDPDATRIVVSFANSERAVVREAARQAIVSMGEVAMWQLRDTYEDILGKKPPRDWGWERTARELFAELDRMRSAPVRQAFDAGRAARARGDYEAMRRAFDEVLAQNPSYERRGELVAGYLEYAERSLEAQPQRAQEALVRALRLSNDSGEKRRLQSLLLTLRAAAELPRGVADVTLLAQALELDPQNARASALLQQLQRGEPDDQSQRSRQWAAALVGLGAAAALVVLLRRRREDPLDAAPGGELLAGQPGAVDERAARKASPRADTEG